MNTPANVTRFKVNTRPQLIARFEAGESVGLTGGAICVYLFETKTDPFFRVIVEGGELPPGFREEFATAKSAVRAASELALTVIYDEVAEITETGEEDEETAMVQRGESGTRETLG